jgi:predicted nucleic acid-binding protein
MTTVAFVDSTTLIYPLDRTAGRKRTACEAWLKSLRDADVLTLSPQVLNESYWAVMRKPAFQSARPGVRSYLQRFIPWTTAPLSAATHEDALLLLDRYQLRFWDALLLASANQAGCAYFLSEDLNDGQVYGAVQVINPFRHAPADVLGPAVLP